jgi:hypothetical protein
MLPLSGPGTPVANVIQGAAKRRHTHGWVTRGPIERGESRVAEDPRAHSTYHKPPENKPFSPGG